MRRTILFLLAALLARPAAHAGAQPGTTFTGPERLFSVLLPAGWTARVEPSPEGPITWITDGTAYVSVMAGRVDLSRTDPGLRARILEEGSTPYFRGWLAALRNAARVQARPVAHARAFGYSALRLNVTYRRGDARDPRTGYALFVQGNHATYFVTATAPATAFPAADRLAMSLRLDGAR